MAASSTGGRVWTPEQRRRALAATPLQEAEQQARNYRAQARALRRYRDDPEHSLALTPGLERISLHREAVFLRAAITAEEEALRLRARTTTRASRTTGTRTTGARTTGTVRRA